MTRYQYTLATAKHELLIKRLMQKNDGEELDFCEDTILNYLHSDSIEKISITKDHMVVIYGETPDQYMKIWIDKQYGDEIIDVMDTIHTIQPIHVNEEILLNGKYVTIDRLLHPMDDVSDPILIVGGSSNTPHTSEYTIGVIKAHAEMEDCIRKIAKDKGFRKNMSHAQYENYIKW